MARPHVDQIRITAYSLWMHILVVFARRATERSACGARRDVRRSLLGTGCSTRCSLMAGTVIRITAQYSLTVIATESLRSGTVGTLIGSAPRRSNPDRIVQLVESYVLPCAHTAATRDRRCDGATAAALRPRKVGGTRSVHVPMSFWLAWSWARRGGMGSGSD